MTKDQGVGELMAEQRREAPKSGAYRREPGMCQAPPQLNDGFGVSCGDALWPVPPGDAEDAG
jgi:hypothetical protein